MTLDRIIILAIRGTCVVAGAILAKSAMNTVQRMAREKGASL
jgi:hypothetical protein